jgi:hypothetical protein
MPESPGIAAPQQPMSEGRAGASTTNPSPSSYLWKEQNKAVLHTKFGLVDSSASGANGRSPSIGPLAGRWRD